MFNTSVLFHYFPSDNIFKSFSVRISFSLFFSLEFVRDGGMLLLLLLLLLQLLLNERVNPIQHKHELSSGSHTNTTTSIHISEQASKESKAKRLRKFEQKIYIKAKPFEF
jgi:hypothetical protein